MKITRAVLLIGGLLFSPYLSAEVNFGVSMSNIFPNTDDIATPTNIGITISTEVLQTNRGAVVAEALYSRSFVEADTNVPTIEFGYEVVSVGMAYEARDKVFFRPEIGFESTDQKFTDGGTKVSNSEQGVYLAFGIGFRFEGGTVGILEYRPMTGQENGYMLSYGMSFR